MKTVLRLSTWLIVGVALGLLYLGVLCALPIR